MEAENNPEIVLDAVLETPSTFGEVTIGEVTILKYAWLERLGSPFIRTDAEYSVESIIPSVFVLASDKATLRKYGKDADALKADALDWADEKLRLEDVPGVIKAVVAKLTSVDKASPKDGGDPKKN